jgi:hypothetical protein
MCVNDDVCKRMLEAEAYLTWACMQGFVPTGVGTVHVKTVV